MFPPHRYSIIKAQTLKLRALTSGLMSDIPSKLSIFQARERLALCTEIACDGFLVNTNKKRDVLCASRQKKKNTQNDEI